MPAEQARVRELQQQGVLETLYVPDGNTGPTGVWVVFNGDSRDLVEHVIESLPLYPYEGRVDTTARAATAGARVTSLEVAADPALRVRGGVFGPMTRVLNPLIRRLAGRPILPMVALVHTTAAAPAGHTQHP